MCKKGELIWMPNLGPYGRYIDRCMGPTITLLNELGIQTLACCCGHGRYPKTIVIVYFTKRTRTDITTFLRQFTQKIFKGPQIMGVCMNCSSCGDEMESRAPRSKMGEPMYGRGVDEYHCTNPRCPRFNG